MAQAPRSRPALTAPPITVTWLGVRKLFPESGFEPDFEGRFLWAVAQAAWPADSARLRAADGMALPEAFPMIYPGRCNGEVGLSGSGGVLWTCSIFPLFAPKHVRGAVLPPGSCGNGHELTPDNLVPAERGTRWRCRHCGADRAATWRRKRTVAAYCSSNLRRRTARCAGLGERGGRGHARYLPTASD
jgi:hypothetical protein